LAPTACAHPQLRVNVCHYFAAASKAPANQRPASFVFAMSPALNGRSICYITDEFGAVQMRQELIIFNHARL
jgi:hypothetical protein